jgi:hypothetical protein
VTGFARNLNLTLMYAYLLFYYGDVDACDKLRAELTNMTLYENIYSNSSVM